MRIFFYCTHSFTNSSQLPKFSDMPYFDDDASKWFCPSGSAVVPDHADAVVVEAPEAGGEFVPSPLSLSAARRLDERLSGGEDLRSALANVTGIGADLNLEAAHAERRVHVKKGEIGSYFGDRSSS